MKRQAFKLLAGLLAGVIQVGFVVAQQAEPVALPGCLAETELLVPDSFRGKGRAVRDSGQDAGPDTGLIPDQFRTVREISVSEQQNILESRANQELYKAQADPRYFEKSAVLFREEFSRRMKDKEP